MTDEVKMHVYDVLAKSFIQEGVRTCFTLMGDANMNWAARLREQGCRMVFVRHEHCAVASAMAYARKTGEVGVLGPGPQFTSKNVGKTDILLYVVMLK